MTMDMKDEDGTKILLSEIANLIGLVSNNFDTKTRMYLIEHLLLSMRELSFFYNKYVNDIDAPTSEVMQKITDIRDAICHRSSKNNWLSGYIKIEGALLFRPEDVEIQYGQYHVFLIKGVLDLYKKVRKAFLNPESAFYIKYNPYELEIEERELEAATKNLIHSIEEFPKNVLGFGHSPL